MKHPHVLSTCRYLTHIKIYILINIRFLVICNDNTTLLMTRQRWKRETKHESSSVDDSITRQRNGILLIIGHTTLARISRQICVVKSKHPLTNGVACTFRMYPTCNEH